MRRFRLALTAATALSALPALAFAQAPPANEGSVDEVVVTASRVATSGFQAPTPTVVFSAETIERQGATNLAQLLNQNPAFKPTINPAANGQRTSQPGAALADLRGLGANRTLILVNGMRVVPMAPANTSGAVVAPDLNTVPSLMVERTEVVTGGASAQWGSDAVGGVVNVILKKRYEGFEARIQGGQSERGDYKEYRIGLLGGRSFLDDRLHVVAGIDYVRNDGLPDIYSRDWGRREWGLVANAGFAANGYPANVVAEGVHTSQSRGGLITGPANFSLRNFEFLPGGQTLAPFQFGLLPNATFMIGGQGTVVADNVSMAPAVTRANPYFRAEFALGESTSAFLEASYSMMKGRSAGNAARDTAITIRRDNAYLPAQVVAAMNAANITTFTMSRIEFDVGQSYTVIRNQTPRIAAGLEGEIGGWSWDAHYVYGRNQYNSKGSRNRNNANFAFATDAVVNNGQVVCRATIPGAGFNPAAAGCTPINLFGYGSPSAAAIAYVNGTAFNWSTYDQHNVAANLSGEPFSTWAGPVSFATGVEYRKESQAVTADPIALASGFNSSNGSEYSGSYSVKEGYVETVVPLARQAAFAESLDLNAAYRLADYSNSGTVSTWKVGATWEPVVGLRFRGTRSRDIRAPALFELYGPGASATNAVSVRGFNVTIPVNVTVGDVNLKPEAADTLTLGAVIEPGGSLRGLRASLDYYNIDLKQAITSLSAANIGNLCNLGDATFCSYFTFGPTGAPTRLRAPVVNAAGFHTSGFDLAVSYRLELERLFAGARGDFVLALNGTYTEKAEVDLGTGSGPIDRAGENSQVNLGAVPDVRLNLTGTYESGPLSLTAQWDWISAGKLDNTFNTSPATTININRVPAIGYLSLYGSYGFGRDERLKLFGKVTNVLDNDPPPVPSVTLFVGTNGVYYDTVGRAFQIGLSYKY